MNNPDVISRFDLAAAQWDANPVRVALARAVGDAIRRAVPLRGTEEVLDFGCGTGLLTLALLPHVAQVTAVDTSREMLRVLEGKLAESGIANVRTLHGDVAELPLADASLDLVASLMVLHHLPDVPAVLARLHRCLRPGGWMAVADLDREDGSFHPDPTGVYHQGFDRSVVCAWLKQAGFARPAVCDAHRLERGGRSYGIFLATAQA